LYHPAAATGAGDHRHHRSLIPTAIAPSYTTTIDVIHATKKNLVI
jgi:hypothetical protein